MATDYNALAAQNGAISSNPPPVSSAPTPPPKGGSVDYNALAAQNGAINSTPAPAAPAPPGVAERAIAGANRSSLSTFSNPQTATEHVVDAITGGTGAGLAAWRTAKSLVDSVKNAMDAKKPDEFSQAKADVQRAVHDFHNRDYRNLAADAGSVAGDAIPVPVVGSTVRNISEGTRPGGDLAGALGQAAGDAAVLVGTAAAPEVAGDLEGSAAATHTYDPATSSIKPVSQPGTLKTLLTNPKALVSEGAAKASTQPGTQAVVRGGAGDIAKAAGVEDSASLSTAKTVEDVADNVYGQSKGLYKQVDDATGGKFAGNEQLIKNVDKELRMASSDEEVTSLQAQRSKYVAQQNQLFDDAAAQGVPREVVDQAKASYKQSQALYSLDRQIKASTKGVPTDIAEKGSIPETIDPKMLSERVIKLYRSGDLTDAFNGDEKSAAQFVNKMSQAAKTQGAAISRAKIGKWIAGSVATAAGAGTAEVVHTLMK